MTEAVSLLVTYLFLTKKINRLQIVVPPLNAASRRVAEKCGFKLEGVMRGVYFLNGMHQDVEIYALLRNEAKLSWTNREEPHGCKY
jgi:RimJ/RimL family protein N-acetyltransferase